MHNQPHTPLDELAALRKENERLREKIDYAATCLLLTYWYDEKDREYAQGLGRVLNKEIGKEE